ncbi:MAG: tetratricopeptide repeat protein, partial [Burkholderiaceae bacterium]
CAYILTGSIRKGIKTVRVNASLVDLRDGKNLWADRFDHPIQDILALQDKITRQIVAALSVQLTASESSQLSQSARLNEDAYDTLLHGLVFLHRFSAQDNAAARDKFQAAASMDPQYARAYANIALTHARDVVWFGAEDRERSIVLAHQAADKAQALDKNLTQIYFARGVIALAQKNYQQAIDAARFAVSVNTNYADAYALLANAYLLNGDAQSALTAIESAKKLNPKYPFSYLGVQGHALFLSGDYDTALTVLSESLDRNPTFMTARILIVAIRGHVGQLEEASWDIAELLSTRPDFSLATARTESLYRRTEDLDKLLGGLRKAGLD